MLVTAERVSVSGVSAPRLPGATVRVFFRFYRSDCKLQLEQAGGRLSDSGAIALGPDGKSTATAVYELLDDLPLSLSFLHIVVERPKAPQLWAQVRLPAQPAATATIVTSDLFEAWGPDAPLDFPSPLDKAK
jgi:hypothetical protein